jgi:hypothetical protein
VPTCRPARGVPRPTTATSPAFVRGLGCRDLIDVHVHLLPHRLQEAVWAYFDRLDDPPWPVTYRDDEATRLATLRDLGVVAHTALAYAHKPGVAAWCNEHTLAAAETHPQVVPTFTFHPEDGVETYVDAAIARGGRIAKVHLQVGRFHTTDPRLTPVWARLEADRHPRRRPRQRRLRRGRRRRVLRPGRDPSRCSSAPRPARRGRPPRAARPRRLPRPGRGGTDLAARHGDGAHRPALRGDASFTAGVDVPERLAGAPRPAAVRLGLPDHPPPLRRPGARPGRARARRADALRARAARQRGGCSPSPDPRRPSPPAPSVVRPGCHVRWGEGSARDPLRRLLAAVVRARPARCSPRRASPHRRARPSPTMPSSPSTARSSPRPCSCRPAPAPMHPVPLVLRTHGWGGTRETSPPGRVRRRPR